MAETYPCDRLRSVSRLGGFHVLGLTDDLDVWPVRGNIGYPGYEYVYPFNVLICRCS
jgi:hypothetical protein